jgi:hypothetical protein
LRARCFHQPRDFCNQFLTAPVLLLVRLGRFLKIRSAVRAGGLMRPDVLVTRAADIQGGRDASIASQRSAVRTTRQLHQIVAGGSAADHIGWPCATGRNMLGYQLEFADSERCGRSFAPFYNPFAHTLLLQFEYAVVTIRIVPGAPQ